MKENNIYYTSDLALATVLSLTFPVQFVDKSVPNRVEFGFSQTKELIKLVEAFYKRELQIEPILFYNQTKAVKARIYDKR